MNKEKNTQKETKQESVSVLEKIRRRTGLLVGIVGLALIIFILESLLGSGASIFGGDEYTTAGRINGKKIDRNEFLNRVENQMGSYRQRNQGAEVSDEVRSQVIESVLQQYVVDNVMMPQFAKAGIVVSEDELYDNVVVNPSQSIIQNLTDPNTGRVNEQFSRPDGSLDPAKWKQAVQNVTGESEMAVRQMEEMVKSGLYFQKFRTIINKGLYITKAEANASITKRNGQADISYVMKRYNDVSDSLVKVTEDDIEKYYKDHSYEYRNPDNRRKVEYVTYMVSPSPKDLQEIQADAERVAREFKGLSPADDSLLMAQESENGNIVIQDLNKKAVTVPDSSIYTAAAGSVFGPYNEGAYFKIYKLIGTSQIADSARVRHVLIGMNDPQTNQPKRSKEQAKREADSILVLLKDKRVSFDSLVVAVSDDMGSKTNGGDYGWFDENEGFVEPFKNAGLKGSKGNITVVETTFGYHIIEVLDVSNTRHTSYRVAQIFKPIMASDETNQAVFAQASKFAGENNTSELFDKAVEEQKLVKRLADNVKEGEYQLPGLEGAREVVKWAFTAEKGDVSIFSLQNKHVVAKLSGILEKGILPLEEVREEVTIKATRAKKAENMLAEFNSKAAGSKDIKDIASKLGLRAENQETLPLAGMAIGAVGHDPIMMGTIEGTKENVISKPVAGEMGVFVVAVNNKTQIPGLADVAMEQTELEKQLGGRTDNDVFYALREAADIEFHKSRID
jgi:peptidyl-prolyl cis-trans isomerase D